MAIQISEIFYSIQGESLYAGRPCVFIRVSGCNLRCTYCDTAYAHHDGTDMRISEIQERVGRYACPLVEVTGGEPLLQDEVPVLIASLLDRGYEVMAETNGSRDISRVDDRCIRVVDVKCPGSGENGSFDDKNFLRLNARDQIKFVLSDRNDYDYAVSMCREVPDHLPMHQILFSPVHPVLNPAELAAWILADRLPVRLHLQLHKHIWPDIERGV